jgi:ribokinase
MIVSPQLNQKAITVFGSANLDIVAYLDEPPIVGETIQARAVSLGLGGKGANQAVAVSKLGARTTLIGAVGNDAFGEQIKVTLGGYPIDLRVRQAEEHTTGLALIDIYHSGDNVIRLSGGANLTISPSDAVHNSDILSRTDVLLLQNEVPLQASLEAARLTRSNGGWVIMDPAPAPVPAWGREVISSFDIFTPNATETGLLLGHIPTSLAEGELAAVELTQHGLATAVVKLGSIGVAWCHEGQVGRMEALKVDAIDTVGAGDCFNAGLAVGLCMSSDFEAAVRFASCCAAISVTRNGAAIAAPNIEEVMSLLSVRPW